MLTTVVLRDAERASLSRHELLALEHLLHERLSEIARTRRSGDSALLLAIKSADFLAPLLDELGDDAVVELLAATAASELGRTAFDRAVAVAALTAPHAA
ncbi:MAG TPA: hypothetical protein VFQ85_03030 [Mycobacteriales bacterium]|jgi:hypothetical protein|nr:hypothetical protein [Mycobacteriales bacterium]